MRSLLTISIALRKIFQQTQLLVISYNLGIATAGERMQVDTSSPHGSYPNWKVHEQYEWLMYLSKEVRVICFASIATYLSCSPRVSNVSLHVLYTLHILCGPWFYHRFARSRPFILILPRTVNWLLLGSSTAVFSMYMYAIMYSIGQLPKFLLNLMHV